MKIKAVAFDVLGTLVSLDGLRPRLEKIGMPHGILETWWSRVVRDGVALSAAGGFAPVSAVAAAGLVGLASDMAVRLSVPQVQSVIAGFNHLDAHPDVRPALELLRRAGVKTAAFSNGSSATIKSQLARNGLAGLIDHVISIDDVGAWKPLPRTYAHAAETIGHEPHEIALIAAHSWDCHGAKKAGYQTGWVRRKETTFDPTMGSPDVSGIDLCEVAAAFLR